MKITIKESEFGKFDKKCLSLEKEGFHLIYRNEITCNSDIFIVATFDNDKIEENPRYYPVYIGKSSDGTLIYPDKNGKYLEQPSIFTRNGFNLSFQINKYSDYEFIEKLIKEADEHHQRYIRRIKEIACE